MAQRIPYLAQALDGRSRWWDFLFGAWFILAGWMLIQLVFAFPLFDIANDLGIDMSAADTQTLEDNMTPGAAAGILVLSISALIVPIAYLLSRTIGGGAGKVFGIIGVAAIVAMVISMIAAWSILVSGDSGDMEDVLGEVLNRSPLAYGLVLFSFIGAILVAWLVQRFIHYRTLLSLVTASARVRWMRIVWTLLLTWGVYAIVTFVSANLLGNAINPNPDRARMLPFVIVTLLFIPIQCAAEEIMFRGYFNQALGRFIPSAAIVFLLTSLAFGAMHLANPEIGAAQEAGTFWIVASSYVVFGLLLSIMVWIDNGLESAIGVHIGNNAWAAIFVNYENSVLPIPGLFVAAEPGSGDIWVSLVGLGAVLLGVWLTRKPLRGRAQVLAVPPGDIPA